MIRRDSFWLRLTSILLALVFVVLPLPSGLEPVRPYLLAMVLCYWLLETPQHVGLGTAFLMGLFVDVLSASLIGENALLTSMTACAGTPASDRTPARHRALRALMYFNDVPLTPRFNHAPPACQRY